MERRVSDEIWAGWHPAHDPVAVSWSVWKGHKNRHGKAIAPWRVRFPQALPAPAAVLALPAAALLAIEGPRSNHQPAG